MPHIADSTVARIMNADKMVNEIAPEPPSNLQRVGDFQALISEEGGTDALSDIIDSRVTQPIQASEDTSVIPAMLEGQSSLDAIVGGAAEGLATGAAAGVAAPAGAAAAGAAQQIGLGGGGGTIGDVGGGIGGGIGGDFLEDAPRPPGFGSFSAGTF